MGERKINIKEAHERMQLSRPVYVGAKTLLLPKEVALTNRLISHLKDYGIQDLWIKRTSVDRIQEVSKTSYAENLSKTKAFKEFRIAHKRGVMTVESALNRLVLDNKEIEPQHLLREIEYILKKGQNGIQVLEMIQCIQEYDDSTYAHSINVALICHMIGKWVRLPKNKLEKLILCGLLHDIGKLMIPADIIKKPGKLTRAEYATIKTHPYIGYTLLENAPLNEEIKLAILQHHEKCDGSGYPNHLKSDQIQELSKIVAIADVYEAMTADRVYRSALCPFDVIETFEQEGFLHYDPIYLVIFLQRIAEVYINRSVQLSNKEEGRIIMLNQTALARPVIQIGSKYVDLSKTRVLRIQKIL